MSAVPTLKPHSGLRSHLERPLMSTQVNTTHSRTNVYKTHYLERKWLAFIELNQKNWPFIVSAHGSGLVVSVHRIVVGNDKH